VIAAKSLRRSRPPDVAGAAEVDTIKGRRRKQRLERFGFRWPEVLPQQLAGLSFPVWILKGADNVAHWRCVVLADPDLEPHNSLLLQSASIGGEYFTLSGSHDQNLCEFSAI